MEEPDLSEDISQRVIAAAITLLVLTTVAVTVRFVSRITSKIYLGADDYLIFLALALAAVAVSMIILECRYGVGKHMRDPAVDMEDVFRTLYIFNFFYSSCIFATKLSIILLYHRIFPLPPFTKALYTLGALITAWWIAVTLVFIFQCRPVSYFWTRASGMVTGSCINSTQFFVSTSIINVITDVILLVLPMPLVWNLTLSVVEKIGVSITLMLGSLACVASGIRVHYLNRGNTTPDFSFEMSAGFVWSCAEPLVGVICACLPTVRPLVRRARSGWQILKSSATGSDSRTQSTTGSWRLVKSSATRSTTSSANQADYWNT